MRRAKGEAAMVNSTLFFSSLVVALASGAVGFSLPARSIRWSSATLIAFTLVVVFWSGYWWAMRRPR